jgi:hypothetical protein
MKLNDALAKHGLLLLQDKKLPSVVGIITGEVVAGSWWSHPRAQEIFRQLEKLDDVVTAKLFAGKVTFVHRRLVAALAAVGAAREPWQMLGLSAAARKLLARVDREGSARTSGAPAKELQIRLLVNAHEEHTESGRHETVLESWPASRLTPSQGRRQLEKAAAALGATATSLPWNRLTSRG